MQVRIKVRRRFGPCGCCVQFYVECCGTRQDTYVTTVHCALDVVQRVALVLRWCNLFVPLLLVRFLDAWALLSFRSVVDITCLLVVVCMRSDFLHRVVLGFDVDEIWISDVILVHALSSEWMVVVSVHDFTKIALSRACSTPGKHVVLRMWHPPLARTTGVDDPRAADNQQQLSFQQLAVRCFPMRLCQHLLRYSLHIGGTWFAMSIDARVFVLLTWRSTLDMKACLDCDCVATLQLC